MSGKKAAGGISQEITVIDSAEAEVARAREELMRDRLELLHDGLTVLILITVGYGVLFTPLGYNYDFPAIIRPTPEIINQAITEATAAIAQAAAAGNPIPDATNMVSELVRVRDIAGNTRITFRGVTFYWFEWLDILRSNEQFGGIVQVTTNILRGGGRIAGMMWGAATDLTTATQIYADTGAIPVEQMVSMKARFELFKLLTPGIAVVAVAGQAMDRLVLNITGQTIAGLTRAGANVGVRLFRAVLGLIGAGLLSFTGEDPLGEQMQGDEETIVATVTSSGSNSTFDPFAAEEYLRMLGQVGTGLARVIEVTWLVAEDAANIADDDSRLPAAVMRLDNEAYALGLGEAGPRYPRTAQRLGAATWAAATEAANIQADDTRLPPAGRYRGAPYGNTQRAMAQQLLEPVRATGRALRAAHAATADVMGIDNDDSSSGSRARTRASPAIDVTYNLRAPEQLLELAGSLGREAREIQDLVTRYPDTAIQQTAIDFIRDDLLRIASEQHNLCHVAMAFRELPRACADEDRLAPGIVRMAMLRLEPDEPEPDSQESGVSTMTMSSIGLSGACMPFGMGVPPVIALAAAADQAQEETPRGALSSLAVDYKSSDDEMTQDKGGKTRKRRKRKQKGGLFKTAKRKKHRRTKHKNYKKGGRRSKRRKIHRGGNASAVAHVAPDPETHLPLA